ncbi:MULTISPECIES: flagellar basal body P-ring formation chaperone FlgA [unclassified Hyphomicrobium]|uniref:flagellar basal body P-ring formation chaperone FlgA n=1 Tax=unclassified Hyphomicrobium TaxID=2619925 RepID=UPI000213D8EB|nr:MULTISPECIES: flagellar basal body P-ring formation chaperone FlgA [unclassified Hyphomicrobium]CCB67550.1 Flagella basal body P-ring formation protein FlgA [Hyphomicrobium sp. MC1]
MSVWRKTQKTVQLGLTLLAACAFASNALAEDPGRTVFVPRAVIYPGDRITDANLIERQLIVDPGNPPVFGEREQDLLGRIARRTLLPGELIPEMAIRAEDLVKQGRTYKLVYNSKYVSIVGVGVPLQSGAAGEIINVRNPESGVIIKARIEPDQTLAVNDQ